MVIEKIVFAETPVAAPKKRVSAIKPKTWLRKKPEPKTKKFNNKTEGSYLRVEDFNSKTTFIPKSDTPPHQTPITLQKQIGKILTVLN